MEEIYFHFKTREKNSSAKCFYYETFKIWKKSLRIENILALNLHDLERSMHLKSETDMLREGDRETEGEHNTAQYKDKCGRNSQGSKQHSKTTYRCGI